MTVQPSAQGADFRLILAPMEGLADAVLRDVLTRVGGYDRCVTEFIRVTDTLLPDRVFHRLCPELAAGSRTLAGTPVRVQLLGSDPRMLGENAAKAASLGAEGIDLNFGCPAPTVNRHRGGAALLEEPALLRDIVSAVRAAVPRAIPVTAKMRLGLNDTTLALECTRALAEGGAEEIVVHARTKKDGYKPPARWEWLPRIREAAGNVPVVANGEVWTAEEWAQLREVSGCRDVMLGRGAVADPFLPLRIRGAHPLTPSRADWEALAPLIVAFWEGVQARVDPKHGPGRIKLWLKSLARAYPEAQALFDVIRTKTIASDIDDALACAGFPVRSSAGGATSHDERARGVG